MGSQGGAAGIAEYAPWSCLGLQDRSVSLERLESQFEIGENFCQLHNDLGHDHERHCGNLGNVVFCRLLMSSV